MTTASTTSRPWLQTRLGHRFYFDDPREGVLDIGDIAAALSKICRFGGHCQRFFSVGEHSVAVSRVIGTRFPRDPVLALAGLLHDGAEAYLGDVPSPLKSMVDFATYRDREKMTLGCIEKRFAIPEGSTHDPAVKAADMDCLAVEAVALCSPLDSGWEGWLSGATTVDVPVPRCYAPDDAENIFITRFRELRHAIRALRA